MSRVFVNRQLQALQAPSSSRPKPPLKSLTGDTRRMRVPREDREGEMGRPRPQKQEWGDTGGGAWTFLRSSCAGLSSPGRRGSGWGRRTEAGSGWDGVPDHHLELFRPIRPTHWAQGGGEKTTPDSRLSASRHCASGCRGSLRCLGALRLYSCGAGLDRGPGG